MQQIRVQIYICDDFNQVIGVRLFKSWRVLLDISTPINLDIQVCMPIHLELHWLRKKEGQKRIMNYIYTLNLSCAHCTSWTCILHHMYTLHLWGCTAQVSCAYRTKYIHCTSHVLIACLTCMLQHIYTLLQHIYTLLQHIYTLLQHIYTLLQHIYTLLQHIYTLLQHIYTLLQHIYTLLQHIYTLHNSCARCSTYIRSTSHVHSAGRMCTLQCTLQVPMTCFGVHMHS